MDGASWSHRLAAALVCGAIMVGSQGCGYLQNRAEDAVEMIDLGFTWSKTPQLALYGSGVSVLTLGYADFDGKFWGIGYNQAGVTRAYEKAWGLLVIGEETQGWDQFDPNDINTLNHQWVGVVGIPISFFTDSTPAYMPACIHHIHLGWGGVVVNLRYLEVIDFLLGWTTLDISGDDGRKFAHWPWRKPREEPLPMPPGGSVPTTPTSTGARARANPDRPAAQ